MKQLAFDFPFNTSYHPADFTQSNCNNDALEAIRNHNQWPSYGLCIVGDKHSGKTHLTCVYHSNVPTAHLVNNRNLTANSVFDISAAHIIIDNADEVRDEKAFFHLINIVKERKGRLLLTAKTPPSEWVIRLPDLKSRLCSIAVIKLLPPDDNLFREILLKLLSDRQIMIDIPILKYILKYIRKDINILNDFVSWIDKEIYRQKKPISRGIFREVLFSNTHIMNKNARYEFLGEA